MTQSGVPWSLLVFGFAFIVMMIGLLIAQQRSKRIDRTTQDVASTALPEIGDIAQRAHREKFGRSALALETKAFDGNGATRHPVK